MLTATLVALLLLTVPAVHAQRRTLILDTEQQTALSGARLILTSLDGTVRRVSEATPSGTAVWPQVPPGRYARRIVAIGRAWREDTVQVEADVATLDTVRLRWPYGCLGSCAPDSAFTNRVLAARARWRCVPLQSKRAEHRKMWEDELRTRAFRRRLRLRPGERLPPLVQVQTDSVCARMADFYSKQFYAADTLTLVYRSGDRYFVSQTGGPLAAFDATGRLLVWSMRIEE